MLLIVCFMVCICTFTCIFTKTNKLILIQFMVAGWRLHLWLPRWFCGPALWGRRVKSAWVIHAVRRWAPRTACSLSTRTAATAGPTTQAGWVITASTTARYACACIFCRARNDHRNNRWLIDSFYQDPSSMQNFYNQWLKNWKIHQIFITLTAKTERF